MHRKRRVRDRETGIWLMEKTETRKVRSVFLNDDDVGR